MVKYTSNHQEPAEPDYLQAASSSIHAQPQPKLDLTKHRFTDCISPNSKLIKKSN